VTAISPELEEALDLLHAAMRELRAVLEEPLLADDPSDDEPEIPET
jgi:hypothetical protein